MKKILVVDDERDIAEMLGIRLEEHGYEYTAAYEGNQAFKKVKEEKPDLNIVDYTIPGLNGGELCKQIKMDTALRHIPVILVSGYSRDQLNFVEFADAFMPKPYHAKELIGKIREFLGD